MLSIVIIVDTVLQSSKLLKKVGLNCPHHTERNDNYVHDRGDS